MDQHGLSAKIDATGDDGTPYAESTLTLPDKGTARVLLYRSQVVEHGVSVQIETDDLVSYLRVMVNDGDVFTGNPDDGDARLLDYISRAETAGELAENRIENESEYDDPAIEERAYADGVKEILEYLLRGGEPTEALKMVLRSGRSEDDETLTGKEF